MALGPLAHDSLEMTNEEGTDPAQKFSVDAMCSQFTYKSLVWHRVKCLGKVQAGNIHSDSFLEHDSPIFHHFQQLCHAGLSMEEPMLHSMQLACASQVLYEVVTD